MLRSPSHAARVRTSTHSWPEDCLDHGRSFCATRASPWDIGVPAPELVQAVDAGQP